MQRDLDEDFFPWSPVVTGLCYHEMMEGERAGEGEEGGTEWSKEVAGCTNGVQMDDSEAVAPTFASSSSPYSPPSLESDHDVNEGSEIGPIAQEEAMYELGYLMAHLTSLRSVVIQQANSLLLKEFVQRFGKHFIEDFAGSIMNLSVTQLSFLDEFVYSFPLPITTNPPKSTTHTTHHPFKLSSFHHFCISDPRTHCCMMLYDVGMCVRADGFSTGTHGLFHMFFRLFCNQMLLSLFTSPLIFTTFFTLKQHHQPLHTFLCLL
jgi:hypothetical protein